jgi:cob(I)alamin adenosyltransferase
MGHRLGKIYTRTGDDGETGLADGRRVPKHDSRVEAFGDVDETNSVLGLLLAELGSDDVLRGVLTRIQHDLFEIGAELSLPGYRGIGPADVERLEAALDALNDSLPPLKDFVLPGGSHAAAVCHVARAVCRRAERSAWRLAAETELNAELLCYMNRLSDLLFVAARTLARRDGGSETLWEHERR